MAAFHEKIKTHRDPHKQIGVTREGDPIFMDLRQLIPSPDEELQIAEKKIANRSASVLTKAAYVIIENGMKFFHRKAFEVSPRDGQRILESGNDEQIEAYLTKNGFEAIQDGLKSVLKKNGRVVSEMTAKVNHQYREAIAKRVREVIRQHA